MARGRGKGSRITSISLDDESFRIKESLIKNYGFSNWIRECLRRYANDHQIRRGEAVHVQPEANRVRGLCNAMNKELCPICWPTGRPSQRDWMDWRGGVLDEKPQPVLPYFSLPHDDPQQESENTSPSDPVEHLGLVRRFIRWLW